MAQYAVFGHPIVHSKSPQIHQQFAAQQGKKIEYHKILVDKSFDAFQVAVSDFFTNGGQGANVTVPFKEYAFDLVDELSERAKMAGAVNTLVLLQNGKLRGDNTDGVGLVRDVMDNLKISLRNKKILIIGAGGAARGVISPLLQQQPETILIANRTTTKAMVLANKFNIQAISLADTRMINVDVIVNATSGSLHGELPEICDEIFTGVELVYDMMYAHEPTVFLRHAADCGAKNTADGLGMLVGQAAESFRLWHNFTPDVAPVIRFMREQLI